VGRVLAAMNAHAAHSPLDTHHLAGGAGRAAAPFAAQTASRKAQQPTPNSLQTGPAQVSGASHWLEISWQARGAADAGDRFPLPRQGQGSTLAQQPAAAVGWPGPGWPLSRPAGAGGGVQFAARPGRPCSRLLDH